MSEKETFAGICRKFQIYGDLQSFGPYGNGHINDTYAAVFNQAGTEIRYILQKLNPLVFKDPIGLMDNVSRVTEYQQRKLRDLKIGDASRRSLRLVSACDGKKYFIDNEENVWRSYLFIEGTTTFEVVASPEMAYEAAKEFGRFQAMLVDLPGDRLFETIPGFHDTPKRFQDFQEVVQRDVSDRTRACGEEIEFANRYKNFVSILTILQKQGEIPERITHNDTKLNNVMIDRKTGKGVCVIDLDTVMPGLSLYDFGDLVRTSTSPAAEDETDLQKVSFRLEMFEALVRGFHEVFGEHFNEVEKSHLAFAGILITFETGLRFLTDFLRGDQYFKVKHPSHNLDRCRTQFKLVELMENRKSQINEVVKKVFSSNSG